MATKDNKTINKEDILRFYEFLNHENQSELRFIEPRWKNDPPKLIQKWVRNKEEFLKTIEEGNGKYNLYVGINERKKNGDKDEDIKYITNIGHDIDAHDGKPESFMKAQEVALKLKEDCIELGYEEPLVICSGRGFWVIHHIVPIENTKENRKKIKEFGDRIKKKYEVEGMELDSSVYNPSRIARIPGTENISDKENPVKAFIINNPRLTEDLKLTNSILDIEIKTYSQISTGKKPKDACAFLDYCLTHEIPLGERHRVISRNMSLYICDNPDRELLKEQYFKIQKGSEVELNQWLKNIDSHGKEKYPFSCGQLINFQKKYKIPLKCTGCPKYKQFKKEKKVEERLQKINKIQSEKDYSKLQKEVLTQLALRERNNATELIVQEIEKENYIYTTKDDIKSEMWIYKNGIYKPDGKSNIKEQVRKILGKLYTSQLYNEIINKIEADTYIEHDSFFQTNYLEEVPLENGILNIFTRKLIPFDPKKIFFNKLPLKYDSSATCPEIETFFSDILKEKGDIEVMLEIFAFSLLKEYKFEKAFMFVGSGRNGKSKTLELLKKFVGIENCCSVPLSMLSADSTSVIELFGKMVNLAGDLSNDSLKRTGMFKQTVGRDVIAAKRKYLRDLTFVNYAKHIFACNELPRVYDLSDGFWTKWVLLEFPYKFIPQKEYNQLSSGEQKNKKILDPDIIKKISTPIEMSGLLNVALDKLETLTKNKDFSYSKGTNEIKELWIRQSDSFTAFCMDTLISDYNGSVSKKELRKEYNFYCKRHKLRGCSDKAIKATLEDRYGAIEVQNWSKNRERYWEGVKLMK